jgi:sirohydrochlorin cobaltochelatase
VQTIIVLAMHGAPPNDFPKYQVALLVGLHMWLEHGAGPIRAMLESFHTNLDTKIRAWPRTAQNDPFYAASHTLAAQISRMTEYEVIVGFNEFCAPSLDEALDQAIAQGTDKIVIVTPMMTPGGEHSEKDIPAAIRRAEERHPRVTFAYAWPFDAQDVAEFLATQVERLA